MNYKIVTPCEKLYPGCYEGRPRVYSSKEEAERASTELNDAAYKAAAMARKAIALGDDSDETKETLRVASGLAGTFSFRQTELPLGE